MISCLLKNKFIVKLDDCLLIKLNTHNMRYIVFDLETQNIFQEVGSNEAVDLDISVATLYDGDTPKHTQHLSLIHISEPTRPY